MKGGSEKGLLASIIVVGLIGLPQMLEKVNSLSK